MVQKTNSDHGAQIVSSLCTVYRANGFHCRRCADFCPVEAVEIDPHGPRTTERCVGCGICYSACPNGAFLIAGSVQDTRLLAAAAASAKAAKPLRISCRMADAASDVVLPCLARLTEASLLAPFKEGVPAIELLHPSCSACQWHRAGPLITETLALSRKLLEMAGLSLGAIRLCDTRHKGAEAAQERLMSRRGLLRKIGARALQVAVEKLPIISDPSDETDVNGEYRKNLLHRGPFEKRVQLLRSIDGFKGIQEVVMAQELAPFAEIAVTDQCTGCKACATLCPTGAIELEEDDASFCLKFRTHLCSNCRLCHGLCRHDALHAKKEVLLNRLLEREVSILFRSGKKPCRICGLGFVGGGGEVCTFCAGSARKRNDLVRNISIMEIR